ncbi:putative odorant-binding protein A5 isoform X2 [Sipha flava]|uniref:Odorant-binding protein A5 isoform X2 n=1 Tax=Sipha flava TaxID=143950 RepID=A0A8B8GQ31_9HEMI|nr:putative odorant-binding protein A5 isoform X2 [Sipha flava]
MWRVVIYFICTALGSYANEEVFLSLLQHGIIPDVIPFPPIEPVLVRYASGAEAKYGNVIDVEDLVKPPDVSWNLGSNNFYTFGLIDAGITSRIDCHTTTFLQWLVINIPESDIAKGYTMAPFVRSLPKKKVFGQSVYYRYVYLVYQQMDKIEGYEILKFKSEITNRTGFSMFDVCSEFLMDKPVAGNLVLVKYKDIYIPPEPLIDL